MQGIAVDIERGLRQKHFPIRVRYILTSDTYAPKTVESEDWVEGKDWIYIYIYTPKPGRSPTRQYGVLSCFFPSRPASDFFLDFRKHLLLAVPANQVQQAEKHLKG